jgi:hypothetical protein
MVNVRAPRRFYFDVALLVLMGVGLGYVVGAGRWVFAPLWITGLLIEIARFCRRYAAHRDGGRATRQHAPSSL